MGERGDDMSGGAGYADRADDLREWGDREEEAEDGGGS